LFDIEHHWLVKAGIWKKRRLDVQACAQE